VRRCALGTYGAGRMTLKRMTIALALATGLVAGGCGVRGPVEMPKADANAPAAPQNTATAESGQNKPEGAANKPHQGFILDGLLR
jgi:predicted small lipoprotein YifL